MRFELSSPAFAEGSTIPRRYTGDGENLSPPLRWSGAPSQTRSFALLCEDPDAPTGTFRHWAVGNIPAHENGLPEAIGTRPAARYRFARNDFGHSAYDGPAPPEGHGLHHYYFRLVALDTDEIDVSPDSSADMLWRIVEPHILAQAIMIGTYQR